jgi:hypothetical protein
MRLQSWKRVIHSSQLLHLELNETKMDLGRVEARGISTTSFFLSIVNATLTFWLNFTTLHGVNSVACQ